MVKYMPMILILFSCIYGCVQCIRCYKCSGGDQCDFAKRTIYVDNCTRAIKCWGARIGGTYIRGCADDRCGVQISLGSFIETKCCYKDLCNDESFFMSSSMSLIQPNFNFVCLALTFFFTLFYIKFNL